MHNSILDNLRFQQIWCESNLRYLLGNPDSEENARLIEYMREEIEKTTNQIKENQ